MSKTRPTWSRPDEPGAECESHDATRRFSGAKFTLDRKLQPSAGFHRQIAVGKGGSDFGGRGVDDLNPAAEQPRRDRAAVVAGPFGGRGVIDRGRIRAPGRHLVDARVADG